MDSTDEPNSWWTDGGQLKSGSETGNLTHDDMHFVPKIDEFSGRA